ncbi:MAG TPA: hypothetical protein VH087_20505 [Thermoanaerobaculia bacterium]|nr:hypothetical protein [Thermoanaerobaculia bacterium]
MSLNTKVHTKNLANICLPMTHDTGTFDLSDILATGDPIVNELEIQLAELVRKLNDAGILKYKADPLAWLLDEAIPSLKGLATTTHQDVATQLAQGIRGFDFRIYQDDQGVFRTFHGLQSTTTFEAMLQQIADFMEETTNAGAQTGEIVYVNLSHYTNFASSDTYAELGRFVKAIVGRWAYRNTGTNDPFNETYKDIIGQGGDFKSRVILTTETSLGDDVYFWPSEYCPPDNDRSQELLAGVYTDTTDPDDAVSTQASQFRTAVNEGLPFANYMTLTPSKTDYVNIIGSSLYGALYVFSVEIAPIDPELALAVSLIADAMLVDHEAVKLLGWTTLEELSQKIDSQLPEIIDNDFIPISGTQNSMTMIFCDFWETTSVVDIAISLSNDAAMEWGGNTIANVNGDLSSTEGPSAEMYDGTLHMVYKSSGNDDMYLATYSPSSASWIFNQTIGSMNGGRSLNATTDKSPAAAVYKEKLYVVWKTKDETLRWATWDGATWAGGSEISINGTKPKTNNSPYITVYGANLVLVHKWNNKDDIHFESFDGTSWSGGDKIGVTDNPGDQYPGTNKRPAVVEYQKMLYLLFKGGHTNNLLQCTYDGASWRGNKDIKFDGFDPKSNEGPGLGRFGGMIHMLYKGDGSDNIRYSTFNGTSWGGNAELKDVTSIDPKSNRSPWAARVDTKMFLLNKGDSNNLYYSMLAPEHF